MRNLIRCWQIVPLLALAACTSSPKKPQTSEGTAEVALSAASRQKGDYRTALKHAQKAIALNPEMASAHFAAGVTADGMCLPNAQPGPNMRECNLAIEEYKRVLQIDPSHQETLINLAYLLWQFGGKESEAYYRRALALDPNDWEVLTALAAITAFRSWQEVAQSRSDAGIPENTPLIGSAVCSGVRQNNLARVNEGISFLTKALQIKNDKEGMVWLSQLYRIRAEIQCGNPTAYRADTSDVEKWGRLGRSRTLDDNFPRRYPPAPPPPPPR